MIKIVKKLKSFKALKMALATLWWGAVVGLALLLVSIIGAKLNIPALSQLLGVQLK